TGLDNTVNKVLHVPPQGDDIYLTIDSRIEKILLQNFDIEAPIDNDFVYKTDRGSVIVSDPTTGEILGILSRPGYDPNCIVSCTLQQLRTDMLAKGYDKVIKCASPCEMQQFKDALDAQSAALIARLGPDCAAHSDCTIDSHCEEQSACNQLYLRYLNSDPGRPLIFRPTQDCYPPGSTYKAVTLLAGLDSGKAHLNDPFYNGAGFPFPQYPQAIGPIRLGEGNDKATFGPVGNNIDGYTHHFPVDLAYGFSHSDNIIFAQVGVNTGVDTWLQYNQNLYVGQQIPFDLPVKVSTVTPQPQKGLCASTPPPATELSVKQLAANAFGQGVDFVTPLQMMLVDNVAANDGKLMRPSIIQKIVDPKNGTILQAFSPQLLRQVVSARTAQQVRDAMYGVSACGSGSLAVVRLSYPYTPWSVIGKTGTAQVPQTDPNKITPGDSWFITSAPYSYQSNAIPRITITAMKENGGEGAYANGPMLRNIYGEIFANVLKDTTMPPAPPADFCGSTGLLQ
ncbi:MAG TPA: penicillin-binding transpeptidase domain-containing protein, partial [Ktedonobacteraceae bacterium]|nr:penicillin-binding transpeptidase domain-containing protein [Ktedonobacteraceae bacterium]